MRRDFRFRGGYGAAYLNEIKRELERQGNASVDSRTMTAYDRPFGKVYRARVPPVVDSIQLTNTDTSTTLFANGLAELKQWHDDTEIWDGGAPTGPGIVQLAVLADDDIPPQATGTAYALGFSPPTVRVQAESGALAGQFLTSAGNGSGSGGFGYPSTTAHPVNVQAPLRIVATPNLDTDGTVLAQFVGLPVAGPLVLATSGVLGSGYIPVTTLWIDHPDANYNPSRIPQFGSGPYFTIALGSSILLAGRDGIPQECSAFQWGYLSGAAFDPGSGYTNLNYPPGLPPDPKDNPEALAATVLNFVNAKAVVHLGSGRIKVTFPE